MKLTSSCQELELSRYQGWTLNGSRTEHYQFPARTMATSPDSRFTINYIVWQVEFTFSQQYSRAKCHLLTSNLTGFYSTRPISR